MGFEQELFSISKFLIQPVLYSKKRGKVALVNANHNGCKQISLTLLSVHGQAPPYR